MYGNSVREKKYKMNGYKKIEVDDETYEMLMHLKNISAKFNKAQNIYQKRRHEIEIFHLAAMIDEDFYHIEEMIRAIRSIPKILDVQLSKFIYKYQDI